MPENEMNIVPPRIEQGVTKRYSKISIAVATGTKILTSKGTTFVEELAQGDLVVTRERGAVPLVRAYSYLLRTRPILIKHQCLNQISPNQNLLVAPLQKLSAKAWPANTNRSGGSIWVTPRQLIDGENILEVPAYGGFRVFDLCFSEALTFYADGVDMLSSADPFFGLNLGIPH